MIVLNDIYRNDYVKSSNSCDTIDHNNLAESSLDHFYFYTKMFSASSSRPPVLEKKKKNRRYFAASNFVGFEILPGSVPSRKGCEKFNQSGVAVAGFGVMSSQRFGKYVSA